MPIGSWPVGRRPRALLAAVVVLFASAIAYLWFGQNGLDDIAGKPCGGLIEKSTLVSVLPDTRDVETGGATHPSSKEKYRQSCFFLVDDRQASVSIVVRTGIEDFEYGHEGVSKWEEAGIVYEWLDDGFMLRTSPGVSDVIAPCPTVLEKHHALSASVETRGDLRVDGKELRKLLNKLALQSLRHVYNALGCSK